MQHTFLFHTRKPQKSPPEFEAFVFHLKCSVCLIDSLAKTSPAGRHLCHIMARSLWGCYLKQSLEDLFLPKTCDRIGPGSPKN